MERVWVLRSYANDINASLPVLYMALFNWESLLTLSSLQTNTDYTFANSADPDETVCNKPSHQDLHSLSFFY